MRKLKQFKKGLAVTLALLMVITMLPDGILKAHAAEGSKTTLYIDDGAISISGDTATYNAGIYTVTNTNGFIITQHNSSLPTFWAISVTSGSANITLQDVNINEYQNGIHYYKPALGIAHGASAKLTVSGSNILKGDNSCAGIFVPSRAELTINGTGSLTAIGGGNGAGIGGSNSPEYGIDDTSGDDCGTVNIEGGTIIATSNSYGGAGIGGGEYKGSGGTVNITGGTVTATGGENAAGIGGGASYGNGGNVTISGGTVTATGGVGGPGIGNGKNGGNAGTTVITGGSVKAVGGVRGIVTGSSGHTEHCVTVDAGTLIGSSQSLAASVQSGSFSQIQTDSSGKLYFWMDENATDLAAVQCGSNFYRLSVPVGTADTSAALSGTGKMTQLDLSQENITIGTSSITAKDTNNQAVGLNPNGYIVMQSVSGSTSNTISVTGGTQNILLFNVSIQSSAGSAFSIASGASVNLSLSGTNTLKSGNGAGIEVPAGAFLTIVGGDSLTAVGCNADKYFNFDGTGIGGAGTVTINGGTLNAYGGCLSTGIGGAGYFPVSSDGTVIINGGVIHAYGGENAAGIGAGHNFNNNGSHVTINGGMVTAQGGFDGAGIGGNQSCDAGTVTVNGGMVTAYGGADSAGIGGGVASIAGGIVNITGGTVFAQGNYDGGAGIGTGKEPWAGSDAGGGTVNISGGMVQAIGGLYSAGIGGSSYGNGGSVNITGGTVRATGGSGIAGICGGSRGGAITVTVAGGSVNSSIQGAPTNGTDSVYLTTVSAPTGTDISHLTLTQNGNAYPYGFQDMHTDNSTYGKLYLWLPANAGTAADLTTNEGSYHGYYGTVGTGNNSVLKMDQNTLTIGGITSGGKYTYGSVPSVTAGGGSGTGNVTYTYTGTDYNSANKPTKTGAYSVTIRKAEDACYYASTAAASFTIEPKGLTGSDVTVTIPMQEYTGSALAPDATVTYNGTELTKGTDYTVSYLNNTGIAESTDPNPPTAIITFIGNYTGSVSKAFTVEAAPTVRVGGIPVQWCTQATLTITPEIGSSGLRSVKVDDGQNLTDITSTYLGGYSITRNGTYTISVTDHANYSGSTQVTVDHIDTAAPTISVSGNPTNPVQSANLAISPLVGLSGMKSITVSGPQGKQDITSTYQHGYPVNQNGTYKFTVTNNAGVSTESDSVVVTKIDTAKPVVNLDSNGYTGGSWTNQNVTLTASNTTSNLGVTKFEYSTDDGKTWTAFNGSITDTDEGIKIVQFRATSESGIASEIQSITVKIDKTAPTGMTIGFQQDPIKTVAHFLTFGIFFCDTVEVDFTASDTDGSGVDHYEYQKVAQGGTLGTSWQTDSLSISPDFKGTVYARAVDQAGNTSGYVTKSLVVDKTVPTITANGEDPILITTDKNALIPVTVTDNGAGIGMVTYQVNGTAYSVNLTDESYDDATNSDCFDIGHLPDGTYDVVVNAQDNSGNSAQTATVHVTQNTQPTVTNVSVTPDTVALNHGDRQQFTASVTGTNLTEATSGITWSVLGNRSSDTSIDENGNLTVASNEAATSLTVTATSTNNNTVAGQAEVTIGTSDQTGFQFSNNTIEKTCSDPAFPISASGGQGNGAVTYTLTEGSDVVALSGNKVTPRKVGTAVITATKEADGSFRQATATLTLHVGKGTPHVTAFATASKINVVGKLASCALTGGSADVPGAFAWMNPDTIVTESGKFEATFTPTDTTNYNSCTFMVEVVVNPVIKDSHSDVAFSLTGATLPSGVTSVSVDSSVQPNSNGSSTYQAIENKMENGKNLDSLMVYNLKLLDQNGQSIIFTGKITVKIPIPSGMSGDLHVYWYNNETGTVTDMNAKQESGYLVFETTHFSYYAIAELSAKSSSGSGSTPNPDTGSNSLPFLPAALPGVFACWLIAVITKGKYRKKAENE